MLDGAGEQLGERQKTQLLQEIEVILGKPCIPCGGRGYGWRQNCHGGVLSTTEFSSLSSWAGDSPKTPIILTKVS